jgi:hypothetical protein
LPLLSQGKPRYQGGKFSIFSIPPTELELFSHPAIGVAESSVPIALTELGVINKPPKVVVMINAETAKNLFINNNDIAFWAV